MASIPCTAICFTWTALLQTPCTPRCVSHSVRDICMFMCILRLRRVCPTRSYRLFSTAVRTLGAWPTSLHSQLRAVFLGAHSSFMTLPSSCYYALRYSRGYRATGETFLQYSGKRAKPAEASHDRAAAAMIHLMGHVSSADRPDKPFIECLE